MKFKEILIRILKNFDVVFRSQKKLNLLGFVLLRPIFRFFRMDETKLFCSIKDNILKLYDYNFLTRAKTLDFLFLSKFYEPEITKFILKQSGKIFLDIGGHIGRYAILASKRFIKVYTFEPHPLNFNQLIQNLQYNNIKNVKAINCAISNKNGKVLLSNLEGKNTGGVCITKKGEIKSRSYKLDTMIRNFSISLKDIDLVMIDVECHEIEVLEGSINLLKNESPTLIIECFEIDRIENFLSKYNYRKIYRLDFYNYVFKK